MYLVFKTESKTNHFYDVVDIYTDELFDTFSSRIEAQNCADELNLLALVAGNIHLDICKLQGSCQNFNEAIQLSNGLCDREQSFIGQGQTGVLLSEQTNSSQTQPDSLPARCDQHASQSGSKLSCTVSSGSTGRLHQENLLSEFRCTYQSTQRLIKEQHQRVLQQHQLVLDQHQRILSIGAIASFAIGIASEASSRFKSSGSERQRNISADGIDPTTINVASSLDID
jgi:hypothetical protein